MTTNTKCPTCLKDFADVTAMRQHFNDAHRKNPVEFTDQIPDSTIDGSLPAARCENCRYWGKANQLTACRLKPGIPAMVSGQAGNAVLVSLYPPALANEWCGSHSPIGSLS